MEHREPDEFSWWDHTDFFFPKFCKLLLIGQIFPKIIRGKVIFLVINNISLQVPLECLWVITRSNGLCRVIHMIFVTITIDSVRYFKLKISKQYILEVLISPCLYRTLHVQIFNV